MVSLDKPFNHGVGWPSTLSPVLTCPLFVGQVLMS